jgi:hypothetical protein
MKKPKTKITHKVGYNLHEEKTKAWRKYIMNRIFFTFVSAVVWGGVLISQANGGVLSFIITNGSMEPDTCNGPCTGKYTVIVDPSHDTSSCAHWKDPTSSEPIYAKNNNAGSNMGYAHMDFSTCTSGTATGSFPIRDPSGYYKCNINFSCSASNGVCTAYNKDPVPQITCDVSEVSPGSGQFQIDVTGNWQ